VKDELESGNEHRVVVGDVGDNEFWVGIKKEVS
jgi:hypothetical protein